MKPILLIDTASPHCAVALVLENDLLLRTSEQERQSAQKALPLVESLLDDAGISQTQLGAIGVVSGPGSFTGMRIGVAIAQGLGFANQIPVVPISSLAALAFSSGTEHLREMALPEEGLKEGTSAENWLAIIPAREQEYYIGAYRVSNQMAAADKSGCVASAPTLHTLIPDQVLQEEDFAALVAKLLKLAEPSSYAICSSQTLPDSLLQSTVHSAAALRVSPEISMQSLSILVQQALESGAEYDPSSALPNYVKEQMNY